MWRLTLARERGQEKKSTSVLMQGQDDLQSTCFLPPIYRKKIIIKFRELLRFMISEHVANPGCRNHKSLTFLSCQMASASTKSICLVKIWGLSAKACWLQTIQVTLKGLLRKGAWQYKCYLWNMILIHYFMIWSLVYLCPELFSFFFFFFVACYSARDKHRLVSLLNSTWLNDSFSSEPFFFFN